MLSKKVLLLAFTLFLTLCLSSCDRVLSSDKYISKALDIPIPNIVDEITTKTILIEKPTGRFLQSYVVSKSVDIDDFLEFYEKTLPQLDWKLIEKDQNKKLVFKREKEILKITIINEDTFLASFNIVTD